MRYVTKRPYSGPDFLGHQVEIPELAEADVQENIICWNRKPICYINSQVARDYFVWADDHMELSRRAYEVFIWFNKEIKPYMFEVKTLDKDGNVKIEYVQKFSKYSPEESRYLRKYFSKYLEDNNDIIEVNNAFFQAPIEDLALMAKYLDAPF